MNPDTLIQLLQKGFRVTLGATASLIEVLQDPERREENLSKLTEEFSELSEEWAAKGEMTEQEARNFVENLMSNRSSQTDPSDTQPATPGAPTTEPTPSSGVQSDIRELTEQLATIRAELEKLREQG